MLFFLNRKTRNLIHFLTPKWDSIVGVNEMPIFSLNLIMILEPNPQWTGAEKEK